MAASAPKTEEVEKDYNTIKLNVSCMHRRGRDLPQAAGDQVCGIASTQKQDPQSGRNYRCRAHTQSEQVWRGRRIDMYTYSL